MVFGCYKEYTSDLMTLPLVNAVAADDSVNNSPAGSNSASWYRILTATFAGGAATGTVGNINDPWVDNLISFKVTAGAGETITMDKWNPGMGRQDPRKHSIVRI